MGPGTASTDGSRSPLVFIPGGPGMGANCFDAALADVIGSWPSVSVDWPDPDDLSENCSREPLFRRFVDAIDDVRRKLGAARVILVGHSSGGFVAQEFALRRPTATAGLVLLNTAPALMLSGQDIARIASVLDPDAWPVFERAMALGIDDEEEWRDAYTRLLGQHLVSRDVARAVAALRNVPLSARRFNAFMPLLGGWDIRRQLAEIAAPMLVIAGDSDWLFPPGLSLDPYSVLGDTECVLVSDAGHYGFLDAPEIHASRIRDWLRTRH